MVPASDHTHNPTPAAESAAPPRAITVYCSSSPAIDPAFATVARAAGQAIGSRNLRMVYGGGSLGLMGETARACRDAGGHVTGIITERLRDAEMIDDNNHETIVVNTMRERKRLMEEKGDAFLVLPGGIGTLEEFFEILVGRLLGEHAKPIALVNTTDPLERERYYDPLLRMMTHMADHKFMSPSVMNLIRVCENLDQLEATFDDWTTNPGHTPGDLDAMLPGRLT